MAPKEVASAPCQEVVWEGDDVDLGRLPIQTCWPGDAGRLITWGLVVTRGPHKSRQNLGIYRQQVIGAQPRHHALARPSRRGARFSGPLSRSSGRAVPARGRAGCRSRDDAGGGHAGAGHASRSISSRGLLRGSKTELVKCLGSGLQVPASSEIVLEGEIHPDDMALEGPFGDHTGYYNEQERFPVFTVDAHHHAARPDLPQHLHRQAAGRAGDARASR